MDKTVVLKKGDNVRLPNQEKNTLIVALGWECDSHIDPDGTVIGFDANKKM